MRFFRPRGIGERLVRKGGAGFTLIELLVVITIIAVLVGILLPSLAGARQQARRLKCLTNLKGWGMAFQLYYDQNKERLPYVMPFYDLDFPTVPQDPQLLQVMDAYMDIQVPYKDDAGVVHTWEPYLCPDDKEPDAGRATGLSYQYWAGGLMMARELRGESPQTVPLTVTRFYELNAGFPVMVDAKPWHPGSPPDENGDRFDKNSLFFGDWRADWLRFSWDPDDAPPPP
jgi:prepilin-type N-terminal cleavage/methylation domain-containing protein